MHIPILQAKDTAEETAVAREIGYGIEEEGIPYVLLSKADFTEEDACRQAQNSPLGVCIFVEHAQVWLFTRMLREKRPLFLVEVAHLEQARRIGKNAARIIRHRPFVQWDASDKTEKGKLKR